MSNDNGKKPEVKYPQLIFKAELIMLNGKPDISFTCKTQHIPTLDTVLNELNYYIINLRAIHKAKQAVEGQSLIQEASHMTIQDIINRGHKR